MPPVAKLRGATLLLVVSIIMIIFFVVSVFSGFRIMVSSVLERMFCAFPGVEVAEVIDESDFEVAEAIDENTVVVFTLVTGAVMLVFGILGIRLRKRAEEANFLIVLGIIHIVVKIFLTLNNNVPNEIGAMYNAPIIEMSELMTGMSLDSTNNAFFTVVGLVLTFGLLALFLLGALLNKLPAGGAIKYRTRVVSKKS